MVWRITFLAIQLMLALSRGITTARAADLALVGAKIYPSPAAPPIVDAVVLIKNDRIVAVGSSSRTPVPAGFKVMDTHGSVLVAGLWNCHVHLVSDGLLEPGSLSDEDLSLRLRQMFVRWGFTTVFDLASTMKSAGIIRDRIQAAQVTGPRILTVGEPFFPPRGTPVYAKPIYEANHLPSAEITDTEDAVRRVDAQIGAGAAGIKLFTGSIQGGNAPQVYMSAGDIRAITTEAHRLRRQTFAHPTDGQGVELAVDNGVDILAHVDPLAGPWSPSLIAKLKAHHIGLIPTLMLFQVYPDPRTPIEIGLGQVAAQVKAGGDILFGTDAGFMPKYDPTQEYQLMRRAMSWRAILASLTTTPARRFGFENRLGRVQPGFLADLTLLDGDPATDVAAFAHVRAVFKAGERIYLAASDEADASADRGKAYAP
jgi:imidazolonepropionase-like amidohydrolase